MASESTLRTVEVISAIKASKRYGYSILSILEKYNWLTDDAVGTIEELNKYDSNLAYNLLNNETVNFDSTLGKFFFKFPGQFKSADQFDDYIKEKSLVVITDLEVSCEGLEDHIKALQESGDVLVNRTEIGHLRVYLNPFSDISLSEYPTPDQDILSFFLDDISIPQEGEMIQKLKIKKLNITQLDCLTAPTEPKQRVRNVNLKAKVTAAQTKDQLFGDLARQAWDYDGVPLIPSSTSLEEANPATTTNPASNIPGSTPNTKQKSNYNLVFDKTTNPEEWELVRKAIYVISKWFGNDLTIKLVSLLTELRERRETDIFKCLGFLPTTSAIDKEYFAQLGLPDLSSTAKKEKAELKLLLNNIAKRYILQTRHVVDRENVILWSIDLLTMFNTVIYRIERLKPRLSEMTSALANELMFCPKCQAKYSSNHVQMLQRSGNDYLCNSPCKSILELTNSQDLRAKYTNLMKKISQFDALSELLSEFRQRGISKNADTKRRNTTGERSTVAGDKEKSKPKSILNRDKSKDKEADSKKFKTIEAPQFMSAMVSGIKSEKERLLTAKPEPFDVQPLRFGDPNMEDYRVYLPVIDDAERYEMEIGIRSGKLLLDNIADFVNMCRIPDESGYYYCYTISLRSLFVAHKRGFRPLEMIRLLSSLSSNGIPPCIFDRIMNQQEYIEYYKAVLVMVNCRYFIRATDSEILVTIKNIHGISKYFPPPANIIKTEDKTLGEVFYWLEVEKDHRSTVKQEAYANNIPIIDEYSFVSDTSSVASIVKPPDGVLRMKKVPVVLMPNTVVRDYQSMSCSKLYWDSFKCHSGILVLPCGAGKTLIGITAFAAIQQPCIIFCQSTLAVSQWAEQIGMWTNLEARAISKFTSHHRKDWRPDAEVIISTYSMFSSDEVGKKRSSDSEKMIDIVRKREWGLMILDEVHQAPAQIFRIVTGKFMCHVKLGLTATLVREDTKVAMLPSLVGPTLYELDVSTLKKRGHIAPIECHEIRLPFTPYWKKHYTHDDPFWAPANATRSSVKRLLFITNPNKILACMTLIKKHLQEKHKIVIFCDDLIGLDCYARVLGSIDTSRPCPVIRGDTPDSERERIVKHFKDAKNGDWLLFSKVGDMSIDLPEARVLIQIAATAGSRMQEGQRIGRIQRKYPGKTLAYAYSLVSGESASELGFSARRRNYLEDHGYSVQIHEMEEAGNFIKATLGEQTEQDLAVRMRQELRDRADDKSGTGKKAAAKEERAQQRGQKRARSEAAAPLKFGVVKETFLEPLLKKAKR